MGMRLLPFYDAWQDITTDRLVLTIVHQGYAIEFSDAPRQSHFVSTLPSRFLTKEVTILLQKGAIEPVPAAERFFGFYSQYFLVPKWDGGKCPVMDLRCLNHHIHYRKFHMVTLQAILPLLPQGVRLASFDLQDVYFYLTIQPHHCQYL